MSATECECIYSAHCDRRPTCRLRAGATINDGGGVCGPYPTMRVASEVKRIMAERDEAIAERDAAVAEREEALATARELLSPDLMRDLRRSLETAQALNDLRAERDAARGQIERALDALNDPKRRDRIDAAWAILTEGQET